jgi:hypothetical protein
MLNTTASLQFQIDITDTTVAISSGTARIGNSLYPFMGARTTFANMIEFGPSDSSKYQNILLYLSARSSAPNLTSSWSVPASNIAQLNNPSMPDSSGFPLSLFTLYSPDGTQAFLVSYTTTP